MFFISIFALVATAQFPEVVSYHSEVAHDLNVPGMGKCSGVFIHPRLLLTAAHCVTEFRAIKMNGYVSRPTDMKGRLMPDRVARPDEVHLNGEHPSKVHVSKLAIPYLHEKHLNLKLVEQDVAILEFDAPQSLKFRKVSEKPASQGDDVFLVGYSHGVRFAGRNSISVAMIELLTILSSDLICESNDPAAYSEAWGLCKGDSGGPLLDAETGEVVGVASSLQTFRGAPEPNPMRGKQISYFIDVTTGPGAAFIRETVANIGPERPKDTRQGH